MPSEVDECLAAASVAGDEDLVELNQEQLRALQQAFVRLCKDYVLMDTSGMKTSMMYSELNNGPDYELFDRKTRRRRHWLAIRHRYEDVKELLWPSDAAADDGDASAASVEDSERQQQCSLADESLPVLPIADMMEALTWLEAASTFGARKHRPFDTSDASDFTPLDLSREVRIVASCVRAAGLSSLLHNIAHGAAGEPPGDAADAVAHRFISLGALCANHGVPLSVAFAPSVSTCCDAAASSATAAAASVQAWLSSIPVLSRVKDAVRVIGVMQICPEGKGDSAASELLRFSDADGAVVREVLLDALCRVVPASLFSDAAALENVDEAELCVLLRYATEIQEQNAAFFQVMGGSEVMSRPERAATTEGRRVLQHFTRLVLARCRHLLHHHDGPPPTLLSGDAENIPFVDLQLYADHNHPEVRVHQKIGRANAQGLRYAGLQSTASTTMAELLSRLESANQRMAAGARGLRCDLLRHVAQKAALGKSKLTLEDVTRALPLLAAQMGKTSEQQVKSTYERLLTAMSTTIAVALQQPQKPACILALLEGLAGCHYTPSSYKLLEMVMLRMMMRGAFTLSDAGRCLIAMLQVVGPQKVSQSVKQAIAMRVVAAVDARSDSTAADVLAVLRALRYSCYSSFASLVCLVSKSPLMGNTANWQPSEHVRYAVLLAAAAAALETEANSELGIAVSTTARERLLLGLSPTHPPSAVPPHSPACVGEDAYQECVTACAALDVSPVPPALTAWAHADIDARPVHSLCTPALAVSTMEALEAMSLAPSRWYTAYVNYLTDTLEQMQRRPLLEDDAETAVRCLFLQRAPGAVTRLASVLLEHEVDRLDQTLTRGAVVRDDARAPPVCTFQQRSLERQTSEGETETRLLRYCAALQHASREMLSTRSAEV
ncbi:conserved hypothetical protein [Leishmania major strain Friedlin]|uniref:Uncharacterized protein n=1 Tax=Leishmania major TaxID=5664 RepID=E9AFX5_LEIMA|nr:conserved hypothetical protein [Leishmania major strain Friedlin]CAG9582858.1 hypothetical_protein_-_conserved [Leishmania major strain Friedlin]CBZ13130.1 conserved hypothetical protein [Leishmania major strain Friedlin]|eukprot:XP_003722895.1 conserved hypothetical protein [Leishmania major strain Friedlin]